MLRVVSPSTLLRTVSLSNGSSNHGFRRNDEKNAFSTFCETIKTVTLMQVFQGAKATERKEDM